MRYAVYFVPDPDSELGVAGARWLGRDVETGTTFAAPVIDGLDAAFHGRLVAVPRRYGFHATLRAPFRLTKGRSEDELIEDFRAFARTVMPIRVPVMSIARLGSFFALVPAVRHPLLADLGAEAVRRFEPFRAPFTEAEFARRRDAGLTEQQARNLGRWGYPYVFDEAQFHMTLTGPVDAAEAPRVAGILEEAFAPVIGRSVLVDRIALLVELEPETAFMVLAVVPLGDPLAFTRRVVHVEPGGSEVGFRMDLRR